MKQITAAYEADDHLRLLELQMTLLSGRDNVFADFNDTQLKYFNRTLQQQIDELEEELYLVSPEANGNIYAMLYAPDRRWMLANVEKHIRQQKQLAKQLRHNLKAIQQEKVFKAFIRDYELEEEDFFPDDFWR
jgi:predicted RNase H-like nuclease (RuvC/YqgF family)